jgi:hypothetical protein
MASQTQRNPFHPTPEQIALSEKRRAKKQENCTLANEPQQIQQEYHPPLIVRRDWIPIQPISNTQEHQSIKTLTWNVCLSFTALLETCTELMDSFGTSYLHNV